MIARIGTGTVQASGAVDFAWCDDVGNVSGAYLVFTSEATLAKHLARNDVGRYEIVVTTVEACGDFAFDVIAEANVTALKMAVQYAGTDWATAKADERAAMAALYEAIAAACDAGVSEVDVAALAGVHRTTVRTARGKI
jgi:hypothetical protein